VGEQLHLDGFAFEIEGEEHTKDIEAFGRTVFRILKRIAEHDPWGSLFVV
jgi:hypothetical protein